MLSFLHQPELDPKKEVGIELLLSAPELIIRRIHTQYTMTEGTVAKKTDKGFGFITYEGADKDLFFHANELQNISFDELQDGDKVSFEIGESPKGPNAVNVSKI